jgi:NADPH:quinone reductase-like Zn-dependent oxidoreductase
MADSQLKNNVWRVKGSNGFDGLEFEQGVPIESIGEHDCLVKIEAVSLNFRDLMIAQVWTRFSRRIIF